MRQTTKVALIAIVLLISIVNHSLYAGGFDMRSCPLNRITFIDPWAGEEFEVESVHSNISYLCADREVRKPIKKSECRGPYGDTVLTGRLSEIDLVSRKKRSTKIAIVWRVAPAVPCCGWNSYAMSDPALAKIMTAAVPITKSEMPRLGAYGFGSIEFDQHSQKAPGPPSNPLIALRCR